jgi:small conductance mechanosensitive channel
MRDFISKSVRRIVVIIGVVVALSALEIEVGPLLAVIAGAGFVIAFALQESLSNLASGIMILVYRPFDVGDSVEVANVSGSVKAMNLVSTTITTFDNKVVVVPNNSVWGGVITNATGSKTRRVDLVFGIGYDSDIGAAKAILERIVTEHPAVLKEPEPNIQMHELAESSVNFICRPWVKTADYWTVYWEVTRSVKEAFDKAGITIPFPQRDVHVHHTTVKDEPPVTEISPAAGEHLVS